MSQADMPSSPIDASVYQYIVGIDIGSQMCSCCILKPDKSPVIKSIEFPNAMTGFTLLQERLEALGTHPKHILIGLEATSRYGENLYRFLEHRGYIKDGVYSSR